jgi:hypothetical protein
LVTEYKGHVEFEIPQSSSVFLFSSYRHQHILYEQCSPVLVHWSSSPEGLFMIQLVQIHNQIHLLCMPHKHPPADCLHHHQSNRLPYLLVSPHRLYSTKFSRHRIDARCLLPLTRGAL